MIDFRKGKVKILKNKTLLLFFHFFRTICQKYTQNPVKKQVIALCFRGNQSLRNAAWLWLMEPCGIIQLSFQEIYKSAAKLVKYF